MTPHTTLLTHVPADRRPPLSPPLLFSECRRWLQYFETMRLFDADLPTPPAELSNEELAERALDLFHALGVPEHLTDDNADAPPRSAQDRVQRALGALETLARKSVHDGAQRVRGRRSGPKRHTAEQNEKALAKIAAKYPDWKTRRLSIRWAMNLYSWLDREHRIKLRNADALQQFLKREKIRSA